MPVATVFLWCALSLFLSISLWALAAIYQKRSDLADVAWGFGFFLLSWLSFLLSPFSLPTLFVTLLVTAWALRLSTHIYLRNRKREEDFRYRDLKKKWGKHVPLQMFLQVFLLQGALLYIIALPVLWINTHPASIPLSRIWLPILFWLVGFLMETVADFQLLRFQKNRLHRGKLLTTGLWSFVRHPNYLGELIQWWAIWTIAVFNPTGWLLVVSPLLLTVLIVKVSGVAPLEEKMKKNPAFQEYAKNTASLIPFYFINGALYTLAWLLIVYYGAADSFFIPLLVFVLNYTLQIYLLWKYDPPSFSVAIPLSLYALLLGLIQETCLIQFGSLAYHNQGPFPPLWLLTLYPLFSLTLNSSFGFLNRSLLLSFFLGAIGGPIAYLSGEKLGAVEIPSLSSFPFICLSWGTLLTILIYCNRILISLREKYTTPQKRIIAFFDGHCPFCSREMEWLKKRKQTGEIEYACPQSDAELKRLTNRFSYREAMETIHAIDDTGKIVTGIDVLSELYARTDLSFLAVWLQAPGFRPLCRLGYATWAKFRIRS